MIIVYKNKVILGDSRYHIDTGKIRGTSQELELKPATVLTCSVFNFFLLTKIISYDLQKKKKIVSYLKQTSD